MVTAKQSFRVMQLVGGGEYFGRRLPIGGAARYMFALVHGLDPSRFETILTFLHEGPSAERAREEGYAVNVVPKKFSKDPSLVFRLARLMKREKVDLVNTHLTNAHFYGRIAARLAGVKGIVSTVHSFISGTSAAFTPRPLQERLMWGHVVALSLFNDRVIPVCDALRTELARRGVKASKLITVPPGVDCSSLGPNGNRVREEFNISPATKIVGTIGRLAPSKNYPAFIEMARCLLEKHDNLVFMVVGDGPQMDNLKTEAASKGVGDRVIFTGWRSDPENFMRAFDVFVLTSWTEAMPITLLEAMACGKPVVVPAVGGIVEAVQNGETGFLYDRGDYAAIPPLIERLLADGPLAGRISSNARALANERYSRETMAEKMMDIYSSILHKERERPPPGER